MKEWIEFVVLGLIWGSAFLWIKIALDEISPFLLVTLRLALATGGLFTIMRLKGQRFPRDKRMLHLAMMALLGPGPPLLMIAWAETRIDSSVASILNGTVPLFTIALAHLFLDDERLTKRSAVGLVMGFVGVIVLMGRDIDPDALLSTGLGGQLMVLVASSLYAASTIYSRRFIKGLSPIVHSAGIMAASGVMALVVALLFEWPWHLPQRAMTWTSVIWLGLFSSCLGFALFFDLLRKWGATRSSLVNYIFPLVGVALGVLVRGEYVGWRLLIGSVLIMSAIAVVNWSSLRGLLRARWT